jgi:tetratricopeptide (TPR) repeat protein
MASENASCNSCEAPRASRRAWLALGALMTVGTIVGSFFWSKPVDLSERFQTGLEAVQRGDWKTVRLCVHRLLQDDEHRANAAVLQAYEQLAFGQSEEAFVTFSQATTDPDTRELAYHEAATILYEAGQFSRTILMCRQVLAWNSARTDSQRLLAAAYYDIGAMVSAINTLKVVAEQQPNDHRPHYMEASILHDFERFEDAALAYGEAAKRVPQDAPARDEILVGWGECLVRLRRHAEAIEVMEPASSGPAADAQRAVALFALRQPDAALNAARSALTRRPHLPEAVAVAAQCYGHNGDVKRGIALLQDAADFHPHELELHLRLADMLGADGQVDAALEHRTIAATISAYRRDFSHKQQALVHNDEDANLRFEIAQLAEQLGKIEIARSWLHAAVGMASVTDEIRSFWQQFQKRHPPARDSESPAVRRA